MKSLQAKLAFGFGGLLAILLVVCLISIAVLTSYSHTLERGFRENYDSAKFCDAMKEALDVLNLRAERIAWADASARETDEAAQVRQFERNLKSQLANCTLPGEMELTLRLQQFWQDYRNAYDRFDLSTSGQRDLFRAELLPRYRGVRELAQQVADANMQNVVAVDGRVKVTLASVRRTLEILMVVGAILAATLVIIIGSAVMRPLRNLILSGRQISAGNLELNIPVESVDEIGQLTAAFNSMASSLREYRRADHERLLRMQETTQRAIDSLPDAVLVISPDGRVEICNTAAERQFQITPDANLSELKVRWLSDLFANVVRQGEPFNPQGYIDAIPVFENGNEKFLLPRGVPIVDANGATVGVTVVLVDVTALRKADEMKSDLLSTASHELRTPLTALRMSVNLLDGEKVGPLSPRQRTLVNAACEESERLFQIIENLLNISRIESGRSQFEFRWIDAGELLHEAIARHEATFAQKGVLLRLHLPSVMPLVYVDQKFIGHAIDNLLSNAMKFTPAGGSVMVSIEAEEDEIALCVADTGPGIDSSLATRVFERFFRVPGVDAVGVGLGLAIAKEIVAAHHGRIELISNPPKGSVFRIILPVDQHSIIVHDASTPIELA